MESIIEKEKRTYSIGIKHKQQTFYLRHKTTDLDRMNWYKEQLDKIIEINKADILLDTRMKTIKLNSEKEITDYYNSIKEKTKSDTRISDVFSCSVSTSFRVYQLNGNTLVFYVFYK